MVASSDDDTEKGSKRDGHHRWFWQKKKQRIKKDAPTPKEAAVSAAAAPTPKDVVVSEAAKTTVAPVEQSKQYVEKKGPAKLVPALKREIVSPPAEETTAKTAKEFSPSHPSVTLVPERVQPLAANKGKSTAAASSKKGSKSSSSSESSCSWLCRTRYFQKLCDNAFDAVDTDKSGEVDEKELYSGLLLIHLTFGMYGGGPAACRPLQRERCSAIFHKMDVDGSGFLDRNEFRHVMMVLFGNVFFRILVQWAMTITIVPLVADRILQAVYGFSEKLYLFVANLDESYRIFDLMERSLEDGWEWVVSRLGGSVLLVLGEMGSTLEMIPDSVWNALPLTIVSALLGVIVVPWMIFKTDDLFQWIADVNTKWRRAPDSSGSV